ncbi:MAG: hypothetical protein JWM96_1068 [Alphaproteobacteria bacterium]|nr:hypothetical protein [Alphaproteobacteria bacterium]
MNPFLKYGRITMALLGFTCALQSQAQQKGDAPPAAIRPSAARLVSPSLSSMADKDTAYLLAISSLKEIPVTVIGQREGSRQAEIYREEESLGLSVQSVEKYRLTRSPVREIPNLKFRSLTIIQGADTAILEQGTDFDVKKFGLRFIHRNAKQADTAVFRSDDFAEYLDHAAPFSALQKIRQYAAMAETITHEAHKGDITHKSRDFIHISARPTPQ